MDTKNAYLLLPHSDYAAEWVKRVVSLLAGGYDLQGSCLQIIMLDGCLDTGVVSKSIEHYTEVEHQLQSNAILSWFCNSAVQIPPIDKKGSSPDVQPVSSWLNSEKEIPLWMQVLSELNLDLSSGGQLVVPIRLDKSFADLKLVESVLAFYSDKDISDRVTVICELGDCYDPMLPLPSSVKRSLLLIQQRCKLIVVGQREDNYNSHFTLLQTACAILDAFRYQVSGRPEPLETKSGLYYSQWNQSSYDAIMALTRLTSMKTLMEEKSSSSLKQWRSNLKLTDGKWDDELFLSMTRVLNDSEEWLYKSASEFALETDDVYMGSAVQTMNSIKILESTSTQSERRKAAAESILDVVNQVPIHHVESWTKYQELSPECFEIRRWDNSDVKLQNELSPTVFFELTNASFLPDYAQDDQAKLWRSSCLDLWELFFLHTKEEMADMIEVSEVKFSVAGKSCPWLKKLLSITPVGKRMIAEDYYYHIHSLVSDFEAYTSPLTGFCILRSKPIEFKGQNYFSSSTHAARDLGERSKEVQQFVYAYVHMNENGFSSEFLNYTTQQIKQFKTEFDAAGCDIIRMYPKYREHVGIEI